MINKLLSIILLACASLAFVSCNDDEPAPQYTYFKPCTNWNASPADVRSYMAASAGWGETMSQENSIFFKNESTQTAIIYLFKDGTLAASIVTVSGFNGRYDDFKNQIAADYGLTFSSTSLLDWAINPHLLLGVAMHRFSTYMTAAYFDINFLKALEIDTTDLEAIRALIEKIKAGLV